MTRIVFNAALLTTAFLAVSVRAQHTNPGRLGPEAVSSPQPRLAAQSTQGASRNTEALAFSNVVEVPSNRDLLSDTAEESRWRTVAISHHAYEIYPVRHDPEDPSLIWFGCNDGGRNVIIVLSSCVFGGDRSATGEHE